MKIKGSVYVVLAALLWSVGGLLTKSIPWSGFSTGAVRGMIAFVLTVIFCRRLPKRPTKLILMAAFCHFAQGFLIVAAQKYTTAANATVLQYTSSIYIIVFTALSLRKLPPRLDIVTCVIMLGGIALAFVGSIQMGGTLGNILALGSGLFYAAVFFLNRKEGADAVESVILGSLISFALLPLVLTDSAVLASTPTDLIYVFLNGLCATLAWLCFAKGIRTTPALQANFIAMLEPVMAPVWTFLLLSETPTVWSLIGCIIVIVTLLIYNTKKAKSEQTT